MYTYVLKLNNWTLFTDELLSGVSEVVVEALGFLPHAQVLVGLTREERYKWMHMCIYNDFWILTMTWSCTKIVYM